MLKRTLVIAALGAALLGGPAGLSHVRSALAQGRAPTADLTLNSVSVQAADGDASAPCTNQGTATEAGNCTDSQNQTGPEDTTGTTGAAETSDSGETTGAGGTDTDTIQSGP